MDLTPTLTISTTITNSSDETPPEISNCHLPLMVRYRECLKNHAASIGGYALDGCGDFMPSLTINSFKCAACGCHRNFHRREPEDPYRYRHRHYLLQLQSQHSPSPTSSRSPSPSSPAPLPISHLPPPSPYYPSASNVLLSLNGSYEDKHLIANPTVANPNGRKRMRSKFSQEQKLRMQGFAEKMDWRLKKNDERLVEEFCNEIGIDKRVFKIWIHNNKQSLMKGVSENLFNGNHTNGVKDSNNNNNNNDGESGGRESLKSDHDDTNEGI